MIITEVNDEFVKGVHPFGKVSYIAKKNDRGILLYIMSIDKGLNKGDETLLAALVKLKPDVTVEVLDCVTEMLKQFANVMPSEIPKTLLPRRDIDHKI